jgi:hypothetical protein
MKYLIILAIVLFAGCKVKVGPDAPIAIYDTVKVYDTIPVLTCDEDVVYDTVYVNVVNKKTLDSIATELFVANYKIERVKYYLNICLRNPSQDKFLKGWIKRAVK